MYSTVQYSTVQYSTVQYSTVQYSTVYKEYRVRKPLIKSPRFLFVRKNCFDDFDRNLYEGLIYGGAYYTGGGGYIQSHVKVIK
jgi:hypothetical protein